MSKEIKMVPFDPDKPKPKPIQTDISDEIIEKLGTEQKIEPRVESVKETKKAPKKEYKMELVKDLDNIIILGRGQSLGFCPTKIPEKTEIWGCNNTYKAREVDRLFIMRDVYVTQFNRETKIIEETNEKGFPLYTLGKYDDLKNNVQYPMQEVIKYFNIAYFLTNPAYMLALAIMQRPKNLYLYGVDLDFGTADEYLQNEKGNLEYWLGQATGRKIKFYLSKGCTLLRRKNRGTYYGLLVSEDPLYHTIRLKPDYRFGRKKSALKYKIVKVEHTL